MFPVSPNFLWEFEQEFTCGHEESYKKGGRLIGLTERCLEVGPRGKIWPSLGLIYFIDSPCMNQSQKVIHLAPCPLPNTGMTKK